MVRAKMGRELIVQRQDPLATRVGFSKSKMAAMSMAAILAAMSILAIYNSS